MKLVWVSVGSKSSFWLQFDNRDENLNVVNNGRTKTQIGNHPICQKGKQIVIELFVRNKISLTFDFTSI